MNDIIILEYLLLGATILGAGYTSWKLGCKKGAENAIDRLEALDIISFEGGRLRPGSNKCGNIPLADDE